MSQGVTEATMVGGPEAVINPPEAPAPVAAAPATPAEPVQKPKIFMGGKWFDSQEDALVYADSLTRQPPPPPQPIQPKKEIDPSDIIFEDPKKALQMVEERAAARIEQANHKKQAEKNAWDSFYEKNPDLRGNEFLVEAVVQKNWAQVGNIPLDNAFEIIAKDARARVLKIRETKGSSEPLSSKPAVTAGPGGVAPQAAQTQPSTPKSFIDEMREMRAAKRKTS